MTLQTALAHYERLLSQSHPQYLAKLRSDSEGAKGSIDRNILYLSTVSIGALTVGPLIGACLFSFCHSVCTDHVFASCSLCRRVQHECHYHYQLAGAEIECVRSRCLPLDIDYGAIPLGRAPLVATGEEESYALLNMKTILEVV